jgi:hypothetical protein
VVRAEWLVIGALLAPGCQGDSARARRASASHAYCTAVVAGVGVVRVEEEYLPRVVACENGAAAPAALEAQAIAARSYLYYRLDREGVIHDGARDQVLSCAQAPTAAHREAVRATAHRVLYHRGRQIAGFFVAGAPAGGPRCRGARRDPSGTESFVTDNRGRRGSRVRRTSLGADDPANRGCMSQRGAACLAARGRTGEQILRAYYGEDVEVAAVDGARCNELVRGPAAPTADQRLALGALAIALVAGGAARIARWRRRSGRRRRARRRWLWPF